MQKGLQNKLVGQAGEYLVCAELARRGLIATSFTGNVPEFDLIVADETLRTIPIQVKTSRGNSWRTRADSWMDIDIDDDARVQIDRGDAKITNPDLIYVCVVLAEAGTDSQDRFFILQKKDLQRVCAKNYRGWIGGHNWKRPRNYKSLDNRYDVEDLEPYEDRWDLIIQQLNGA